MEFQLLKYFIKYIFLFLIFENQSINSFRIEEKFPISFLLSNQDLFLVTKYGFRLYDRTFKTLKNFYDFDSNLRLITTEEEAEQVSIAQFSNGIIIALVRKFLYIFDINCNYILEQNLRNILINGWHYDLIAYKYDSSFYYYIISYYDSSEDKGPFSIKYFSFALDEDIIIENPLAEITYLPINSEGQQSEISKYGLSCQIMLKNEDEFLTCFYQLNHPYEFGVTSFIIEDTSIFKAIIPEVYIPNNQSSIIKAVTSPDKKKALICYTKNSDYAKCLQYDITLNQFSNERLFFNSDIRGSYLGIQVYYIKEKNEYMFVSSDDLKGFKVVYFDSNFQSNYISGENDNLKFNYGGNCFHINSYNIIYLSYIDDYILINDCEIEQDIFYSMSVNLEKLSEINNIYPIQEDVDILYNKTIITNKVETEILTQEEKKEDVSDATYTILSTKLSFNFEESNNSNSSIIFETTTKSKEEIINNLDDFINDKNPEGSYVIDGDDYTVIIKPINGVVEESSVNIDFSECEKALKGKYPDKQFRILQINMENKHENCLTDQVEYKIYDENGDEINLSICDEVNILIEYEIKNKSILNLEEISNFKEQGVDVFNIKHDFFNDICYSYSDNDSNSDMILEDRLADIYQNYSICGYGCKYESFNLDKVSANCNCKVKKEMSTESEKGNFEKYIAKAFLDSNFGVVKCYNLVFSLIGKLKNAGFWIFGLMVIFHFPIYIFYFIKGLSPVKKYINNEMDKKGYKINMRSKNKKRSISLSLESRSRKKSENKESEASYDKKGKEELDSNPPKKQNLSFSSESNIDNNKKHKKIKITKIEKKHKSQNNFEVLSDNDIKNKRKNILKNKISKRISNPELIEMQEIKDILIGLTQNKSKEKKKAINRNSVKFSEDNYESFNKEKKYKKGNIFSILETNVNSPTKSIKKEKSEKLHSKKKSVNHFENEDNYSIEKEKHKEKKKISRNFKKNNNLVDLDSKEYLDTDKKNKRNNVCNNKIKSRNAQSTIGDDKKEEIFKGRNSRKMPTQFPLILINASNTKNHEAFKSNYVLDNYNYDESINKEKRPFCRIYFIFLISRENTLNFIFYNPPLELKPIRLCIFIFSFSCDFALNALFYLSGNISDKYHYTGAFRELFALANNIIISLTSTIVSFILLFFFRSLTQSNSKIEKLFREQENILKTDKQYKVDNETIREIKNKIEKIIKCLNCKLIIFLILEFILMLFFFYYVTAFCQVYSSTQISWLLDCLSSYVISMVITLVISFLCTILYKLSIKYQIKILYRIIIFIYSA